MKYTDIMLDLETLGVLPNSLILSIGAVAFNSLSKEIGPTLYEKINMQSSLDAGFKTQKATIEWWARQDVQATNIIEECVQSPTTVRDALMNFSKFIYTNTNCNEVCVWGCGSDFDNTILGSAYELLRMTTPWKYNNSRCYRTVKSLFPHVVLERTGIHHNALDDAKYQTTHLIKIFHNKD